MGKYQTNNEYLFIGAIADQEMVAWLNSKGCKVSTGYNVQRKMIDGLERLGHYSDTITGHVSPRVGRDTIFINYSAKNRNEYVTDISVSFVNLPLIDKLVKKNKISRETKKWIREKENPKIFVYSLTSAFLLAAVKAKRKNKKCKIVAIVPDLPEFMSNGNNKLYRLLKKIDRRIIDRCLKEADAFILFSEHMKERIAIEDRPYSVIEGIIRGIDEKEYLRMVKKRSREHQKIIMLSGNLDYEEGIQTLLEAFSKIEDAKYRLWLTGAGNAVDLIRNYEKADERIRYFGYIDSYEKFLQLQQQAFVFVLMVTPEHPKSKYYFPSKLMEYLVTGGIVACYKLDCIPDEYDEYLEYFSGDAGQVGECLRKLCEMDSETYEEIAIKRINFINQKSPEGQMKKVESMVEKL